MTTHVPPVGAFTFVSDSFPSIPELREDFEIFGLLDFCVGIDAAVLHDRIVTPNSLDEESGNPALDALVGEGVVVSLPQELRQKIPQNAIASHPATVSTSTLIDIISERRITFSDRVPEGASKTVSWALTNAIIASKELAIEDLAGVPIIPSMSSSMFWREHPVVKAEERGGQKLAETLAGRYHDFAELLLGLRATVDGEHHLPMPPIALQVLTRADRPEQLGEVLLEVRHDYEKVRRYFNTIGETLASPDVSLKAKLAERAKLERAIKELVGTNAADSFAHLTSFASTANDIAPSERFIDGIKTSDFALGKLLSRLVKEAESAYWRFRLRPLHATKRAYLSLSLSEIRLAAQRHFGHTITTNDEVSLAGFQSLAKQIFPVVETYARQQSGDDQDV